MWQTAHNSRRQHTTLTSFFLLPQIRRRLEQVESEDICCDLTPVEVDFDDPLLGPALFFDCFLHEADDDVPYAIDLPEDFVTSNTEDLLSGFAVICSRGGATPVRSIIDGDFINVTDSTTFYFLESTKNETEPLKSPRSVLIVRVIGDAGDEPPQNSRQDQLAEAVFGTGEPGSDSAFDQYDRCSFGKLQFIPAEGHPQISNGVMDVQIDASLEGRDIYRIRTMFQVAAATALNVSSLGEEFDHVIFCVPDGTVVPRRGKDWGAFARIGNIDSYYNSRHQRCTTVGTLAHELGHNLGMHHSGTSGQPYGDRTGTVRRENRAAWVHVCCSFV